MNVILTDNPADRGNLTVTRADCACDCQCACPTEGAVLPVLPAPVACYLELTPACNNACPGCGNVYEAMSPHFAPPLDGPAWKRLITLMSAHVRQFKLTGGEPTLHPDLADLLRHINALGIPFTLFSNGRWQDGDGLLALLSSLECCEGLLISLHGPDAPTHEAFSGVVGSFAQTTATVCRAVEAGLDVSLSMVINRLNFDRIEATLDLAMRLGANHLVVNRLLGPLADGRLSHRLTPQASHLRQAMLTVERLRMHGRPIRFGNCIPQCFEPSSSRGCTAGRSFATVDPWGRLRPCNHAPVIAGDLNTQSVEEVWHGEVMRRWRAMLPTGCAGCAALAVCYGGCRAQALWSETAHDPLINAPLSTWQPEGEPELRLWAGLRPLASFARQQAGETAVLLNRGTVVAVPATYWPLLDRLDGSLSLQDIHTCYGPAAVEWIGVLHRDGMVDWAQVGGIG